MEEIIEGSRYKGQPNGGEKKSFSLMSFNWCPASLDTFTICDVHRHVKNTNKQTIS